jgi:hypothetical protein
MSTVTNEQILEWMEQNVAHRLDLLEAQVRKTNGTVSALQEWKIASDAITAERTKRNVVIFRGATLFVGLVGAFAAFLAGHFAP